MSPRIGPEVPMLESWVLTIKSGVRILKSGNWGIEYVLVTIEAIIPKAASWALIVGSVCALEEYGAHRI